MQLLNASEPVSGVWNGYFLENHRPEKGWMHLFLAFADGQITGEGIDYVGPWTIRGHWDPKLHSVTWQKNYLHKHTVNYVGKLQNNRIIGTWRIGNFLSGNFAIWPEQEAEMEI